jgi:hypothetical protein
MQQSIALERGGGSSIETKERPHVKRRVRLKNGNPPGDFFSAPR